MKRRQFLGYSLLFLEGCAFSQVSASFNLVEENLTERLRFAVTDVQGLEKLEKNYEKFRNALEAVLQTPIEFFPVESYTAAVVALQFNQVDLVLTGPSEYVLIHSRTNAIPLIGIARPQYYSVIATTADSPIKSLQDLKGKTIAMRNIGSTGGHLGPTQLLMEAGLRPNVDYQAKMLGVEKREIALKNGTADAWAGSISDYENYLLIPGFSQQDFPILKQGYPLPNDLLVVSSLLRPQQIEAYKARILNHKNQDYLLTSLVTGKETQKYQGSKFVPVRDADYDSIRQIYQAIGSEKLIQ